MNGIDTTGLAPDEGPRAWADTLASICGRLLVDDYGANGIHGSIACGSVGQLKLCRLIASSHRISLSADLARTEKHPVVKIIVQNRGYSIYEQDGSRLVLSPGECLVYDVSRPHLITSPTETDHHVVVLPREIAAGRGLRLNNLSGQRFSARSGAGRLVSQMVVSAFGEIGRLPDDCGIYLAHSLLDMVRSSLAAAGSGPPTPAQLLSQRIKDVICENIRDPDLSIAGIAQALHCSKRYLHMAFADEGLSITDYIWLLRLDGSLRDLTGIAGMDRTLTDVAFSWGFSSSSHFSRLFKSRFGYTPSSLLRRPAGS